MNDTRPGAIAFLGLGLIGGSIAKAVAASAARAGAVPRPRITAWSDAGRGPARALEAGVIDAAATSPDAAIDGADLVVIAAPPLATIELIRRLGSELRPALAAGALITDVASTKVAVMNAAAEADIAFVGGHPMAGREAAGFAASTAGLFVGRPWILVAGRDVDADRVGRVRWLIEACQARPVELDAAAHDAAVAAVSHVPLVASVALAEAMAGADPAGWPLARSLAASGWESMTRLARGDAEMGGGILATNAPAIAAGLRAYREVIDDWIAALEAGRLDPSALERRLAAVRVLLGVERDR